MIINFIFLGLVIGALLYAIVIYNALVALKHAVTKAWANIDVLLKQRHDELPKLIETCKQYMKYEQETLEKVMRARSAANSARESGDVQGVGRAETEMRLGLGKLARMFAFKPAVLLEFSEEEKRDVDVKAMFAS